MATVFLEYNLQTRPLAVHQGLYSLLTRHAKTMFSLTQVHFHYVDEDGEKITVNSQADFQEALKYAEVKGMVKLIVGDGEVDPRFIQDLPMTESQVLSEEGSIPKFPPVQSLMVSEALPDPVHASAGTSTAPVQQLEKEVPCMSVPQQDQSSSMDRTDQATNMDHYAVSCETAPIATQDSTSDARPIVELYTQSSGPDQPVSVGIGTAVVEKKHELSGPEGKVCIAADTQPIHSKESAVQCEGEKPPLPFDLGVIKALVQDEIRSLFPVRRSLLRSRISRDVYHLGFSCHLCGVCPIKGARFKCLQCQDFSLCEDCEDSNEHEHVLLKLRMPEESGVAMGKSQANPLLDEKAIKSCGKRVRFEEGKEVSGASIEELMVMGFSRQKAEDALRKAGGDLERAIESLLGS